MAEFAGRQNVRNCGTMDQMVSVVEGLIGKRLMCRDLTADHDDDEWAAEDIERETLCVHGG